jgi:hypothetical protein
MWVFNFKFFGIQKNIILKNQEQWCSCAKGIFRMINTKIKITHTSHMIEELSDEAVSINSNYYSNRKLASANLTTIQFFDHIYT